MKRVRKRFARHGHGSHTLSLSKPTRLAAINCSLARWNALRLASPSSLVLTPMRYAWSRQVATVTTLTLVGMRVDGGGASPLSITASLSARNAVFAAAVSLSLFLL